MIIIGRASSNYYDYNCTYGFNGEFRDQEGGMWASNNEGVGAWIEVIFKKEILLTRFQYLDRKNPLERNSMIELTFSNGENKIINLINSSDVREFKFDLVKTSRVKITIKEVYGTINNGGAFKFYGIICQNILKETYFPKNIKNMGKIESLFKNNQHKIYKVNCKESFSNSNKFNYILKKEGTKIHIDCPESCINTNAPVYGNKKYSQDSALCRAAFHSDKLPSRGGKVTVLFGQRQKFFKGKISNSIISESKDIFDRPIEFLQYKEKEEIILTPGSKVDLANPKGTGFLPGVIKSVKFKEKQIISLKIEIEKDNSPPISFTTLDKMKIKPCGEYLKERDCNLSRKSLEIEKSIKIRFFPKEFICENDVFCDFGDLFGEKNKSFGWTKNMTSFIHFRNNQSLSELETFVEFPPSPSSDYCLKCSPTKICEPVEWIAKVGIGKFIIRIYIGDPDSNVQVNLKINYRIIVKNKIVEKNKLEVIETIIETYKEFVVITSECLVNCGTAITKINAIEFIRYNPKVHKKKEIYYLEEYLECGNSYKGGRCQNGPDVIHCLFDDLTVENAKFCIGDKSLIEIPQNYKCESQIKKFKCVFVLNIFIIDKVFN